MSVALVQRQEDLAEAGKASAEKAEQAEKRLRGFAKEISQRQKGGKIPNKPR